MKTQKLRGLVLTLVGICLLLCSPAWAEDNLIRFGPGYWGVTGDYSDPPADLDNGAGFFVDYERTINDKWGVDFCYEGAIFDLGLFGGEDVDMYAITARANYYFSRGERASFFVHPTIGLLSLDFDDDSESGLALGAGAGVDVTLGKSKWVFSSELGYITADVFDKDFNNIVVHVGVGRRF